ncbi:SOS response-associated peptidase family protein [Trinickia sp. EG282A]|uniref:SOS response-associated peptidase family protein n=1 Tax=Trinickia sp. EG282A TaxID=3237013 RepID=UPI0034D25C17
MCYSAQIKADYRKFLRTFGARIDLREFVQLYWEREQGRAISIPKAIDAMFDEPQTNEEQRIKEMIARFDKAQAAKLEQEIFKQRARLADAERSLQAKATKAATESKRIATNKIEAALQRLDDLRRTELNGERDARIFPGHYAPVVVLEGGERVVKPMRYQCRLAGKPAFYDTKYPGTYIARRDNLEGFWKTLFGYSHGLLVATAFYEHVSKARLERRELKAGERDENVILEFKPNSGEDMLLACLWSRWEGKDEPSLLSFAAITDEPPPEIAAVGHTRCIIPIKPNNVDAWLRPDAADLAQFYAVLDDRERPYYEHLLAA